MTNDSLTTVIFLLVLINLFLSPHIEKESVQNLSKAKGLNLTETPGISIPSRNLSLPLKRALLFWPCVSVLAFQSDTDSTGQAPSPILCSLRVLNMFGTYWYCYS